MPSRARTTENSRKRTRRAAVLAVVALVAVATGCSSSSKKNSTASLSGPPPIPSHGAYLGAWVKPDRSETELSQLAGFVGTTTSHPAILSVYAPTFTSPAPIATLQGVVSQGAIPLVTWGCTTVTSITNGQNDQLIRTFAEELKSFDHPVFLRWFSEMNYSQNTKTQGCLGSSGPSGYVAAWIHIWNIFHQVGATNVAFVWCPGTPVSPSTQKFFPGANYVDWIGADGYDHDDKSTTAFHKSFRDWYNTYSKYGKPMMIAETAAFASLQAEYLEGVEQLMPSKFPQIKALVYFDSTGPAGNWELAGAGVTAFQHLASNPYFTLHA